MSASQLPDFTGRLVDGGRFHLTDVLGSGNYGVVYKALDTASPPHDPIHYAIKCLGPVAPNSTQGSRHDEREIRLHSLCSLHPNVVTLHRRFCDQGFLFVVLELSAGGHLFDAIDAGVFRNNDALVREVFLKLLDAVRFCHERGVYHRDLKPENILCSAGAADIRIADFGLATDCPLPSTSAGGSVSYMSPESLTLGVESESYLPHQSDVWALCIILLNMMSGLYPWRKAIDADAGFDAFLTDARYLRRAFPISDPLNDLLERCFRPVPHTRPTLLQLRTEIAAMEQFFVGGQEQKEERLDLLRPVCYSAPPSKSMSSAVSFAFSALGPSSNGTSLPSSTSFDSSALRPTRSLLTRSAVSSAVSVPTPPSSTSQAAPAPAPKNKHFLKRVFGWVRLRKAKKTSGRK
ncbi:Kinase-like protein [Mycena venus]|uniref:non-specific serine/threonine protein kinase n=1 Tax=Mycena venus TaxID=2733690 RepID=A0A8H6YW67_9AGAR|nr:Kinase-like protein [Mycena venus]